MKNIKGLNRKQLTVLAALFWLAVWQGASMIVKEALFLPAPFEVLQALLRLVQTGLFWRSAGGSLGRITIGFLLGFGLGGLFAVLAHAFKPAEILLRPLLLLVRATPVASFVILSLAFIPSKNLAVLISLLMSLPIFYGGISTGISSANEKLLEVAAVFKMPRSRRVRAIYLPALKLPLLGACELAFGMCWKSGVAAEVIGVAPFSIGGQLYESKIFLQMADMFAWTLVIILLSWLFGRVMMWMIQQVLEWAKFAPLASRQDV